MFFPERIKNIKPSDIVLEIGPGGTPHPRSNIFLEMNFDDEKTQKKQRGNTDKLIISKPVIYYDGKKFPFKDKEFDYIICSHVIEHVVDIDLFISELLRVGHKGYIEYPTIYYEYMYNFSVHVNFIKLNNEDLVYLNKSDTHIQEFFSIQKLFYISLEKGYTSLVDNLKEFMFEGFEWEKPFSIRKAETIEELTFNMPLIPEITKQKKTTCFVGKLKKIRFW